jgi:phytoene/squalene synthetase
MVHESCDGPPEASKLDALRGAVLFVSFQALPAEMRAALWLRFAEGARLAEVADCLGRPLSTLERELQLAGIALRARLRSRGLRGAAWLPLKALLRELPAPEPRTGFLQDLLALWEKREGPSAR